MKLCKHVLVANICEKSAVKSAILILFANKRITKCWKVAKYQQHLATKNFLQ